MGVTRMALRSTFVYLEQLRSIKACTGVTRAPPTHMVPACVAALPSDLFYLCVLACTRTLSCALALLSPQPSDVDALLMEQAQVTDNSRIHTATWTCSMTCALELKPAQHDGDGSELRALRLRWCLSLSA
jgi:hypothetical protein